MNLTDLSRLSTGRLQALSRAGIHTVEDLLMHFPLRYLDRQKITPAGHLTGNGETVTVVGSIVSIRTSGSGRKRRLEVVIEDEAGRVTGVWFRGASYFRKLFKKGLLTAFFGSVKRYGRNLSMAHPEVEILEKRSDIESLKRIVPIYPSTSELSKARITHRQLHEWILQVLDRTHPNEFLPEPIRKKHNFPIRHQAFRMVHNPDSLRETRAAIDRFKYEELFLFELSMARVKQIHFEEKPGIRFRAAGELTHRFFNSILPFELTDGQKHALSDIKKDLRSGVQMHRLIQGDVGAGKTVVAIGAILMTLDNGYQAAFMAPTEILAEQHYHTLSSMLQPLGLEIRLLTGSQKTGLRRDILTSIEGGACQIVVGTHAVIQEKVRFHKLGLAVIDEQHRFGVKQRAEILSKGDRPHLLVMSATPIPRSLAMTVYSDLDISLVKGMPAGRKPVRTAVRGPKQREEVYRFVGENVRDGGQVYIVYPLVEESEAMDLKDATMGYQKLKKRYPDLRIGLVHGQLKSEEKEEVMKMFKGGELDILVSTTVIEVGVDIPNANVMIIEHAERFGLSQLHQLRGRIGRGVRQSYCILMPDGPLSQSGKVRLSKMVETSDGFEIAETDLKLRGPGDFLGTKQSGLPEFRHADIIEDRLLLEQAKQDAWELTRNDPQLEKEKHKLLKRVFNPYFKEKAAYFGLG